jgi:hypothetical protein
MDTRTRTGMKLIIAFIVSGFLLTMASSQQPPNSIRLTDWGYLQSADQTYQSVNRKMMNMFNAVDSANVTSNGNEIGQLLSDNATLEYYKKASITGRDNIVDYYVEISNSIAYSIRVPMAMFVRSINRFSIGDVAYLGITLDYLTEIYQSNFDSQSNRFVSRTFQIDENIIDFICSESDGNCLITGIEFDYLQYPKKIGNFNDIL